MKAVKCPVCEGSGRVANCHETDSSTAAGNHENTKQCHGCDGKGWIALGCDYPKPVKPWYFTEGDVYKYSKRED